MAETKINANQTNGLTKQYNTLPTASANNVGEVAQVSGKDYYMRDPVTSTTVQIKKGFFYTVEEKEYVGQATVSTTASVITSISVSASTFFNYMKQNYPDHVRDGNNVFTWNSELYAFELSPENYQFMPEQMQELGITYSPEYPTFSNGDTITVVYTPGSKEPHWVLSKTFDGVSNMTSEATSILIDPNLTSVTTYLGVTYNTVAIGYKAQPLSPSAYTRAYRIVCIGDNTTVYGSDIVAVGSGATTTNFNHRGVTIVGPKTKCGSYNFVTVVGAFSQCMANYAIQIGSNGNSTSPAINSDANTFKVANQNGNFEIMSVDGTIPEARLADTTSTQEGDVLTLNSSGNAVWTSPLQYVLGGLQTTDSSKVGYLQYYFEENNAVSAPAGGKWLVLDCLKVNTSNGLTYVFSADFTSPVGSIVAGGTQIAAARSGYTTRALLLKIE